MPPILDLTWMFFHEKLALIHQPDLVFLFLSPFMSPLLVFCLPLPHSFSLNLGVLIFSLTLHCRNLHWITALCLVWELSLISVGLNCDFLSLCFFCLIYFCLPLLTFSLLELALLPWLFVTLPLLTVPLLTSPLFTLPLLIISLFSSSCFVIILSYNYNDLLDFSISWFPLPEKLSLDFVYF